MIHSPPSSGIFSGGRTSSSFRIRNSFLSICNRLIRCSTPATPSASAGLGDIGSTGGALNKCDASVSVRVISSAVSPFTGKDLWILLFQDDFRASKRQAHRDHHAWLALRRIEHVRRE